MFKELEEQINRINKNICTVGDAVIRLESKLNKLLEDKQPRDRTKETKDIQDKALNEDKHYCAKRGCDKEIPTSKTFCEEHTDKVS